MNETKPTLPAESAGTDTAWKAQERLCRRYRKLARAGKPPTVVTTAIARHQPPLGPPPAGNRLHLASALREGRKRPSIDARSRVIGGIPAKRSYDQ